jgi:23S rRNA-/tRNA-specific pseudouridylate synthase
MLRMLPAGDDRAVATAPAVQPRPAMLTLPAVLAGLPVLHADDWLLAVHKPAGLLVHRTALDAQADDDVVTRLQAGAGHAGVAGAPAGQGHLGRAAAGPRCGQRPHAGRGLCRRPG